jgi:riboflavin kinase/FMN adenylyltransferase
MAGLVPIFRFPQDEFTAWTDWRERVPLGQSPIVAIGNFDGFHRGHQALIKLAQGLRPEAPIIVYTFDPHPAQFFLGAKSHERLFDYDYLREKLSAAGCAALCCETFDQRFSQLSAREFVERLVRSLGLTRVVVGFDFRFGKNRTGDTGFLRKALEELGGELSVCAEVSVGGDKVGTSRIRQSLLAGDMLKAKTLLGNFYEVRGVVVQGDQLGRQLGFPTANLQSSIRPSLKLGVYYTQSLIDGVLWTSITNVGIKPTLSSTSGSDNDDQVMTKIETHLVDFVGDLYGRKMTVKFLEFIRPEKKFVSLEALKQQISLDVELVRQRIINDQSD